MMGPNSDVLLLRFLLKIRSVRILGGGGSQQLYYYDCSGRIAGHTTRVPRVGFELETNSFQFYAIANLDKISLTPQGRHR